MRTKELTDDGSSLIQLYNLGTMPRKTDEESEDLDSNAPLLPQPASASSTPSKSAHSSTLQPQLPFREQISLKWWHPVLGAATVVLLWTAISVSGLTGESSSSLEKEDPKWPTWPDYRGPTPTVSYSLTISRGELT